MIVLSLERHRGLTQEQVFCPNENVGSEHTPDLPPVVRPPFKFLHADPLIGAKVRVSGAGGRCPSALCGRGVW